MAATAYNGTAVKQKGHDQQVSVTQDQRRVLKRPAENRAKQVRSESWSRITRITETLGEDHVCNEDRRKCNCTSDQQPRNK